MAMVTSIKGIMPVMEILEARWSARLMANQFFMELFHGELELAATRVTRMSMQRFLISQTGFLILLNNNRSFTLSRFYFIKFLPINFFQNNREKNFYLHCNCSDKKR